MYPRMLVTVDEDMQPVPISVRVGQAVDTVGQAGKPKTITGFQTHTTPVSHRPLVTRPGTASDYSTVVRRDGLPLFCHVFPFATMRASEHQ